MMKEHLLIFLPLTLKKCNKVAIALKPIFYLEECAPEHGEREFLQRIMIME